MREIKLITLELTNRCDLRCRMCDIWREKRKTFLTIGNIKRALKLFEGPVSIALTGGEPFLHPDFDEVYKLLCLNYLKKKVNDIDISTNAAGNQIPGFLKRNRKLLTPLSVSISVDGLTKTHDRQRGAPGSFNRTLSNIKNIRRFFVPVSIKFTVTSLNYKEAFKVYLLSKKLGCEFLIKLAETNPRYYNRLEKSRRSSILRLRPGARQQLEDGLLKILTLEKKDKKRPDPLAQFAIVNMLKFLRSGDLDFIKRCGVPERSLFITSEGKIHSCIYYAPIGNINDESIQLSKNKGLIARALKGRCHKCLAFHGFLNEFDMP